MQYLFDDWTTLEKRFLRARHILLCADFDGTITPIKPRPKDARLPEDIRLLLRKLSKNKSFFVGIISGRLLKDIRQKVAINGLIFAGNHGLEIAYKKKNFIYPAAKRFIAPISRIGLRLKKPLALFPGAILEEKKLSLSLHYRLVKKKDLPRLKKIFLQVASPYLAKGEVKLTYGKKVWELRPPLAWDKGRAVLWLVQRLKSKRLLSIYIGDDLTDEDGFRAVNKIGGISILTRKKRNSSARYYLKGIKEVQNFLEEIEKIKARSRICQK